MLSVAILKTGIFYFTPLTIREGNVWMTAFGARFACQRFTAFIAADYAI